MFLKAKMFRRFYSKSFIIQSLNTFDNVIKHIVQTPNCKYYGFIAKPSVREKSHISFRNPNVIEKKTKTKLEDDPMVITLETTLQCTKSEAISVYVYFTRNAIEMDLAKINQIVKWLHKLGAETSIILKNCHLFSVPLGKNCKYNLQFCWKAFF